jgi:hypothetical protein
MPERREVLDAGWHAAPREDRSAAALVKGFLNAWSCPLALERSD